jgi:hypothetical protein
VNFSLDSSMGNTHIMIHNVVFTPAGPGKYRAPLGSMAITKPTRQPFYDAARALIELGYAPETVIVARHAGSDTVAMRGTIGELAQWTIKERDRGGLRKERWQPYDADSSFPVAPKTAAPASAGQQSPLAPEAA